MAQEKKQSRYLEYLPAIYHTDVGPGDAERPEGSFVGHFLLPFEEVLARFEHILATIDERITPGLTPDEFVPWLASWVAMSLDENWHPSKHRRLIQEAIRLYRHQGMAEGIKGYLGIYDERLAPIVREGRWPAGMQIGVASQIGGLAPEHVPLARIEQAERHDPPAYHDYYVVDTVAQRGHPQVPEGQPLRLYHRADRVKRVGVGEEPGKTYVRLDLVNGESRLYEPASVTRRDRLPAERYAIALPADKNPADMNPADKDLLDAAEPTQVYYRGDSFLIDDIERLYRFTVDIQVSCQDWEYLFCFRLDRVERDLPEAFREELAVHGLVWTKDASITVEEQGLRWWLIEEGDPEKGGWRALAVRRGVDLDVYRWSGRAVWEEARHPHNVRAIRAIIEDVKPAHTEYYLELSPLVTESVLQPMQVGVRSTIDLDARIG